MRRGLLVWLTTSQSEVKCDVAAKTVNGDLGRFPIEAMWGRGAKSAES